MKGKLLKNPYKGINAHLHSMAFNSEGSPTIWTSIHSSHIGDITNELNRRLPPQYVARAEQSLQVWTEDMDTGDEVRKSPRPDSVIYQPLASSAGSVPTASAIAEVVQIEVGVREIRLKEMLIDEIEAAAVIIYRPDEHGDLGEPITRIEVFSPTNKYGFGKQAYLQNRLMALRGGTSLVELDYVHQFPSPLPEVPPYPRGKGSHPYSIAVTDRRADKNPDVIMVVREFSVDTLIPVNVLIPLADDDDLLFDFNTVYHYTFETGRWGIHIDYELPPRALETYSVSDQKRIARVMEQAKKLIEAATPAT